MASVSVHVAVRGRNTSVAHGDGNLMKSFGKTGPKIPVIIGTAQIGMRFVFYGVVQIGKFQRIADE